MNNNNRKIFKIRLLQFNLIKKRNIWLRERRRGSRREGDKRERKKGDKSFLFLQVGKWNFLRGKDFK